MIVDKSGANGVDSRLNGFDGFDKLDDKLFKMITNKIYHTKKKKCQNSEVKR